MWPFGAEQGRGPIGSASRRPILGAGLALALLAPISSAVGQAEAAGSAKTAASSEILLGDCGGPIQGPARPVRWDLGCTGVNDLARMTWTAWGGATATGYGVTQLNDCSPDCASGTVEEFPALAAASRIRSCRASNQRVSSYYTRVRIVYDLPAENNYGRPGGRQDFTLALSCRSPRAALDCGDVGREGPGQALNVRAKGTTCRRARRFVRRAKRLTCRSGCTTRKRLQVGRFRCRYGRFNRRRFYVPVRCSSGRRLVTFRVAID